MQTLSSTFCLSSLGSTASPHPVLPCVTHSPGDFLWTRSFSCGTLEKLGKLVLTWAHHHTLFPTQPIEGSFYTCICPFVHLFVCFDFFKTGNHHVAQASLKFWILQFSLPSDGITGTNHHRVCFHFETESLCVALGLTL